ncbi:MULTISPECIES: MFS transporter [unclassified Saccharothrix]|uniref:MFS transporter n=1 Tax=unclassified Saccharothrix TaxID=2593673 RepID=UPI00307DD05C
MSVADTPAPAIDRKREQRGWVWYDWANQVFTTSVTTVFLSGYLTAVAKQAAREDTAHNGPDACATSSLTNCDISAFGTHFPAGSLWGFLLSIATVVQVVVLPVMGAIADRTQNKRAMLGGLAFTGAAATAALAFVAGSNWQLGVVLFILANICYGASIVVYYAFLPEIATADERDAVSSRGWAFGYLGGGLALAVHLGLFLGHDALGLSEAAAVRVAFVLSGIWWAAFTFIPLTRLKRHQQPHGGESGASVITAGFKELRQTMRLALGFPLTLAFLGTYLIYTDGIATVANVSAQYGREELKLDETVLIATILIVQFVAFGGAMLHGWMAKRWGAKRTIMISLVVWIVVLAAAYFVQQGQQFQFYALAVGIGIVLGGTNALSRSLFSQMIPPGREAQYFSLYEVGERSTSWLGPLVFAGVGQATGSFRLAIISLVIFFVIGFVLMIFVPVRKAIKASGNPLPAKV